MERANRNEARCEIVIEFETSAIPLLASPQGGVAASSKRCRAATEADAAGVVFLLCSFGKPPRPRDQRRLRDNFLTVRPPLLAVMQGGEYCLISHFFAPLQFIKYQHE